MTHPIVKVPVHGRDSWPVESGALTRSPPQQTIAMVYLRDSFTGRYCGRWTVPSQILRLISVAFPFHPNWVRDVTPRAYWDISTSVDHVHAVSTGRDLQDPANLATACARCQYQKSSLPLKVLGWELRAPVKLGAGEGMMSQYPALWEATGQPDERHHKSWIRAFSTVLPDQHSATGS